MIEKILERLKNVGWVFAEYFLDETAIHRVTKKSIPYDEVVKIVQEVAKDGGWISCRERLPDTNDAVNITWVNRKPMPYYRDIKDKPFTATGHYHNGKWYWYSCVCKYYLDEYGNSDMDEIDKDIEVIAWQPLPAPYQKGE